MSKLLPAVEIETLPLTVAVQVHQTERPDGLSAWKDSPGCRVAPTLDALMTTLVSSAPPMTTASARLSLAGAGSAANTASGKNSNAMSRGINVARHNLGRARGIIAKSYSGMRPAPLAI